VQVTQTLDLQLASPQRPECLAFDVAVDAERPVEFTLKIRLPWWLRSAPTIVVNGTPVEAEFAPASYVSIRRTWQRDRIHVELPKGLTTSPLPDRPDLVAFMDGPVVLAGLCDEERTLYGDADRPETILVSDNEREWRAWRPGYGTRNQDRGIRFQPLSEIVDERYTVYFPVEKAIAD
jgi:DUF1680 family protein